MRAAVQASLLWRAAVAILAIGGMLTVFGVRTFPYEPVWLVVAWVAGGALALLCLLVLAVLFYANVAQWGLRHGGTDPAWFWFRGEPPGLKALRDQAAREPDKD
jgi:hypothetical protein